MLRSPISARKYRDMYGRLETAADAGDTTAAEMKATVDAAFDGVSAAFTASGFRFDNSDAAEAMVGFIFCYLLESNPSFRGAVPAESEAV